MEQLVTMITGTSKGIGRFLAEYYAAQGHLVIGCSRSEINWSAPNYEHYVIDITDENKVKELFRLIRIKYGRLDHLINNAGIASMNHVILTPAKTVHKIMDTNVTGTFIFCREAAKIMKRRNYGRIVNFVTVATPLKLAGEAAYAASKAAVLSLSQIVAKEFAEFGITVNVIGPTPIHTDLIKNVPPEKLDNLLSQQAIRRYGTFQDVANVVDFYLRRESGFITGQTLYLGGV